MVPFRRTSFGLKQVVQPELESDYASRLVASARANGGWMVLPTLCVRMPAVYGFCHGVERAISLAYETRRRFPNARLFITDEIVHNPVVNGRLIDMGYRFLHGRYATGDRIEDIGKGDVVLLPAFGVESAEVARLRATGAFIVDTTCGEVMSVWRTVHAYARDGYTAVIHGTPGHQETRATASRVTHADPFSRWGAAGPGRYLVVRDLDEAERVCSYIEGESDRTAFLAEFAGASSPGFDPDSDLERVGIANQTTMLAAETLAIQARFLTAFVRRHGDAGARERLRLAETICTATQERQDAIRAVIDARPPLLLVVGGYNSANTRHLATLGCECGIATFHVSGPESLVDRGTIRHWDSARGEEVAGGPWWPAGEPATIAVAAGASTPDRIVGALIQRLIELAGERVQALDERNFGLPPSRASPRAHDAGAS
jgi:4-hydroxy-3-methylbut-2-enyl diphosphate reductase